MNDRVIITMLQEMSTMTKNITEGVVYTDIPTYLKNHVPGITPEYIEVFRDIISPLQVV